MPITIEAVRPIELSEIQAAHERIRKMIVRTPLIRLELGPDQPDNLTSTPLVSLTRSRPARPACLLAKEDAWLT
jgi:hypothetical protein